MIFQRGTERMAAGFFGFLIVVGLIAWGIQSVTGWFS